MSVKSASFRRGGLVASLALIATLGGCETATQYRPATGTGFAREGYSDRQIEANRFEVRFAGNTLTSRETVEKYLLYRAAELTLQQGADYFVLADRDTDHKTRTYSTGGFGGYGYGGYGFGGFWGPRWAYHGRGFGWRGFGYGGFGGGFGDPFFDDGFDVNTVDKYEASAEIVIGRGPKPANDIHAFDAHDVVSHLGPSIVTPAPR